MRVCNEKFCYWHILYRDKHVEHNLKDIIHQILEDRKGISKTKRQNQIFVMACRSIKGNLLLIFQFNSNKTVCITEVERKKNLLCHKAEGKRVPVLDGNINLNPNYKYNVFKLFFFFQQRKNLLHQMKRNGKQSQWREKSLTYGSKTFRCRDTIREQVPTKWTGKKTDRNLKQRQCWAIKIKQEAQDMNYENKRKQTDNYKGFEKVFVDMLESLKIYTFSSKLICGETICCFWTCLVPPKWKTREEEKQKINKAGTTGSVLDFVLLGSDLNMSNEFDPLQSCHCSKPGFPIHSIHSSQHWH